MTDIVKDLKEQLKEAKAEGKVENKKSKFLKKKTTGEKINKLLKEAAYGKEESKVDDFGLRKEQSKGGRVQFRGGGICKRGINKKAIGANS